MSAYKALAAAWRTEADALDRTAKAYNRKCVEAKGTQMILLAKQLRGCADQVEAIERDEARKAQAESRDAAASQVTAGAATESTGETMAEDSACAEANHWPSTAGQEREDQAS